MIESDPEDLARKITELQQKLKKKHDDLARARIRLVNARHRIQRLKGIVSYQRERILQLYQ